MVEVGWGWGVLGPNPPPYAIAHSIIMMISWDFYGFLYSAFTETFFRYQTCYAYMKYLRLNGVLGWVMGFTDLSPTLLIFHTMGIFFRA